MWKRIFNSQKSIKSSLVILLILSSIIPLLVSGIISYSVVNSLVTNEVTNSFETSNAHKVDEINSLIASLERVMDDLSGSETTKGYLLAKDNKDSEISYINLVRLTEKIESDIYQQGPCIDGINLVWKDGTTPIARYNSYDSFLTLSKLKEEPYSQMTKNTPSTTWFFEEGNVYLYKSLYSPISDNAIGSIIIKVNSDYLKKLMDAGNDTYSCLVTEKGIILHTNAQSMSEDEVKRIAETLVLNEGVKKAVTYRDNQYIVAADWLAGINVLLVDIASVNEIIDTRKSFAYSIVFSSIFAIVFASFFATVIFRHINDPIRKLEKGMLDFKEGRKDHKVVVERQDEFGKLADNFNEMTGQIEKLIEENISQQKTKQKLEMSFLQAQITPHFLYNTLNVIKILAKQGRNKEVIEMSTSLIDLLRLASKGSERISISQELQYTESYTKLMSIRKEQDVDLSIDANESLLNCEIPKFSIQPFVENSIIHSSREGGLNINILVRENKKQINITIEDNAGGFDKKLLKEKKPDNNKFSSIGIDNVSDRIKLYYGKRYGVKIDSIVGEGTKVVIRIPKREIPDTEEKERK